MTSNMVMVLIILALALLLANALWKWYKHYHMCRAMIGYFLDQFPDADTFNKWFNWAEACTVRKLLKRDKPPKPHHAPNYRTSPTARLDIDRQLVEKHIETAFADIADVAELDTRRASLHFLCQYFGLSS